MTPHDSPCLSPPTPPTHHEILSPVPDLDNQRWCRACQTRLPLSAFPSGKRRYLCRRHMWERSQKPHRERKLKENGSRNVCRLWRRCWEDSKVSFGQSRISLIQRDVAGLIAQLDASNLTTDFDGSSSDDCDVCTLIRMDIGKHVAIMPADPVHLLSPENAVVVDMAGRRKLLSAFKAGGREHYTTALAALQG